MDQKFSLGLHEYIWSVLNRLKANYFYFISTTQHFKIETSFKDNMKIFRNFSRDAKKLIKISLNKYLRRGRNDYKMLYSLNLWSRKSKIKTGLSLHFNVHCWIKLSVIKLNVFCFEYIFSVQFRFIHFSSISPHTVVFNISIRSWIRCKRMPLNVSGRTGVKKIIISQLK